MRFCLWCSDSVSRLDFPYMALFRVCSIAFLHLQSEYLFRREDIYTRCETNPARPT